MRRRARHYLLGPPIRRTPAGGAEQMVLWEQDLFRDAVEAAAFGVASHRHSLEATRPIDVCASNQHRCNCAHLRVRTPSSRTRQRGSGGGGVDGGGDAVQFSWQRASAATRKGSLHVGHAWWKAMGAHETHWLHQPSACTTHTRPASQSASAAQLARTSFPFSRLGSACSRRRHRRPRRGGPEGRKRVACGEDHLRGDPAEHCAPLFDQRWCQRDSPVPKIGRLLGSHGRRPAGQYRRPHGRGVPGPFYCSHRHRRRPCIRLAGLPSGPRR